jgi:hypothetical protein
MSELNDDAIDKLLLDRFEGPVPDDGFCDRAMQTLPPRRRRAAWPLALGIVTGGALCWLSLLATPLLRVGWRDWASGELSAPVLILLATMASISLLAMAWTAAETDDR